jgi:hypothetical protein
MREVPAVLRNPSSLHSSRVVLLELFFCDVREIGRAGHAAGLSGFARHICDIRLLQTV